jgi:hypothetical protein
MLSPGEKAYSRALIALKEKRYEDAVVEFEKAAPEFGSHKEFNLFRETTRLLLSVRKALAGERSDERIEIEEAFSRG